MSKSFWTEQELARLRDLWERGRSSGQCAAYIGRTRNSVLGQVRSMGLCRKGGRGPNPAGVTLVKFSWEDQK
jgi:hypothetical protein